MPLDPNARAALDILAMMPAMDYSLDGAEMRVALAAVPQSNSPFAAGDEVDRLVDMHIDGNGQPLGLRLYYPKSTASLLPVTLYLHGGGFVFGSPAMHDNLCRCLANRAESLIVSVDYRLAPETKFPGALDDVMAALGWLEQHAEQIGGDPGRIAIAGDSAGGNLAAAAAQLMMAKGGLELCHQLLLYPVTDCRFDTASYQRYGQDYFLTLEMMRWYWRQYLPDAAHVHDPRASVLRADDLAGLPSATVITAEYDPLCDEGEAYAKRLSNAGVPTRLHRWGGQIHGFMSMLGLIPAADQAVTVAAQALRKAFNQA